MRIGFDAKRLYNNFTGLGNYSRTLVRNLIDTQSGNQHVLFTPKIKQNALTDAFINSPDCDTILPKIKAKGIWRSMLLPRVLTQNQIDVYHGLSNEIPFNIEKFTGKSVVTIHDLIFKRYPNTYKTIDRNIYDHKFKYSCKKADHVIAISESTKRDIVDFYNIAEEKISVIYQPCDPIYYNSQVTNAGNLDRYNLPQEFLLYVGSFVERKNIIGILKAYAQLSPSDRIPLVLVGRGDKYKKALITYATKQGLEKSLIWIEDLYDNTLLKQLYAQCTAFIYISLYEGFGLPVAEASLCKAPVITSRISSMPEAASPSTLLVNPDDHEEIADAIKTILKDSNLRDKMINDNYAYAHQNFNAKTSSDQIMKLYKSLVS